MKTSDISSLLRSELPQQTDIFSTFTVEIVSQTFRNGGIVEVITADPHGLDEAELLFTIAGVEVDESSQLSDGAINTEQRVLEVISTTEFTYQSDFGYLDEVLHEGGVIHTGIRVVPMLSEFYAGRIYSAQKRSDIWCYVSLLGSSTSRDVNTRSDAVAEQSRASGIDIQLIKSWSIAVYYPTADTANLSGDEVGDLTLTVERFLIKSLGGVQFPTAQLNAKGLPILTHGMTPFGMSTIELNDAFMGVRYEFQDIERILNSSYNSRVNAFQPLGFEYTVKVKSGV